MTHKNVQLYFFILLILLVLFFNILVFLPFLKLFLVVAIFATVSYPIYNKINKSIFKNRNLAAGLSVFVVLGIILIPIIFFIVQIFYEARDVYVNLGTINNNIDSLLTPFTSKLNTIMPFGGLNIESYISNFIDSITSSLGNIFSSIFKFISVLVLGLIILFFFLRDGNHLVNKIIKISPLDDNHDKKIINKIKQTINSIIRGSLIVSVLQGLLAWFGLLVFGVPNPALWGGLTIFASLVPGVGTALVLAPAILYVFYTGTLVNTIGLLLWSSIIVGLVDNVVRPFLVGSKIKVHPFLILLSILGGLIAFGFIGLLVGPLLLSIFLVLIEIYPSVITKVSE